MKKLILLAAAVLFPFGSAFGYIDGGLGTVSGANGYNGLKGYAELGIGDGLYVRPAFDTYKADGTDGTFATYSGRVGYDGAFWGTGVEAGVTPKHNGYGNKYVGGDVTFSLTPSAGRAARLTGPRAGAKAAKGDGVARVDVGAGLTATMHENDKDASGVTLADPFKVTQTDMSLFAGAMAFGTQLSASYRKNLGYSKTLNPTDAEPQKVGIEGSLINGVGYVNQSWNARLDWVSFPMVAPFASYTFTQYKLSRPSSKSYMLGASVGLNMLNVNVAYQIFDPGEGYSSKNYISLGAGLNF